MIKLAKTVIRSSDFISGVLWLGNSFSGAENNNECWKKKEMPRRNASVDHFCFPNVLLDCSLTSLKRLLDCVAVMVLVLVSLTLIYRPTAMFRGHARKMRPSDGHVKEIYLSGDFADDGFSFTPARNKEKYLSYEPPVGSWSKQLQAFENAVIISKLLNRTLLARALISELEIKRLMRIVRKNGKPDSSVYELLDKKFKVPLSSVVDFNHLSRLVKVHDVDRSYYQFLSDYKNLSCHEVCQKNSVGFWVDFIPANNNHEAWKVLEAQDFVPLLFTVPALKPICDHELQMQTEPYKPEPFIRGIISELNKVDEDIVYFREGSIATSDIRFLSKKRTALAQKWVFDYIRFTPYLQMKIQRIMANMKKPYNALLIPREDEKGNLNSTIYARLKEMEKMKFRGLTNVLYIITHIENLTVFEPLRTKGYEIYLSKSMIPNVTSSFVRYDVSELMGLMICKYARLYVGPSDPYLIQRGRVHEAKTKDGLLADHVTVKWAVHTVKRGFRFNFFRNSTELSPKTWMANYISCTVCKFMQGTEKHKLCLPLISACAKLRLN